MGPCSSVAALLVMLLNESANAAACEAAASITSFACCITCPRSCLCCCGGWVRRRTDMASEAQLRSFLQLLLPELLSEVHCTAFDLGHWPSGTGSTGGTGGTGTQASGDLRAAASSQQAATPSGKENAAAQTATQPPSQQQQQQQSQQKPEKKSSKLLTKLPGFLSEAGMRRPATAPLLIGSLVFGVPELTRDYALGGAVNPSQEALAQGALGADPRVQPLGVRASRWSVQAAGPALAAGMQLVRAMLACGQGAAARKEMGEKTGFGWADRGAAKRCRHGW